MNKILASLVAASFLMTGAAMAQTTGATPAAMTSTKTVKAKTAKVKHHRRGKAAPAAATTAP
jgi:hypothetical protein